MGLYLLIQTVAPNHPNIALHCIIIIIFRGYFKYNVLRSGNYILLENIVPDDPNMAE